nr:glycerol-3-phosphate dehydrogenase [Planctomycetota bacterium]
VRERPELAGRIHADAPFCAAEAVYAAHAEMALSLDDVLRRRVPVAILARLDRTTVTGIALAIAPALGWTIPRAKQEALVWHARAMATARAAGLPTV